MQKYKDTITRKNKIINQLVAQPEDIQNKQQQKTEVIILSDFRYIQWIH